MPFGQKKEVMEKIVLEEPWPLEGHDGMSCAKNVLTGMSGRAFRALELDYKLSSQCKKEWNTIQVGYLLSFSKDVLQKSLCLTLPHRHLLLHGPPGTGKTLFARTLARQSGAHLRINGYP